MHIHEIKDFFKKHYLIMITLVILNFLLFFLGIWGKTILQNEVSDKNNEKGISQCSETANGLDNIVFLGENVVNFLERDYRHLKNSKKIELTTKDLIVETFNMISQNSSYFFNIYIASDGKTEGTVDSKYENSSPIGRAWYENAINSEDLVMTNPYQDIITNENVITISKKVQGTNDCVVGLDIKQSDINKILEKHIDDGGSVSLGFILNTEGIFVGYTNDKAVGLSINDNTSGHYKDIEPYIQEILKNDSGKIDFDGNGYSYSLIYQKTKSNWHVIYRVDKTIMGKETTVYKYELIVAYLICFILLNFIIIIYYIKRLKAISLKNRAENAEKELTEYKEELEELIDKKIEAIRIQSEKLQNFNTDIIDIIADIVEFRDFESGQHIKRIKKYTYILATKALELYPEYKIDKDKIEIICIASALHDIGKIGIPDSILLKPSKLTFEEFEEMKKHTIIGADLATRILAKYDMELAKYSYEICRYHHERYNGKGYPDGLKGDEIPICAQVVGIADVYDALIEKRVYKEAYSHEQAINMIKNWECGKFSEKLMYCLELVKDEFYEISKKYE